MGKQSYQRARVINACNRTEQIIYIGPTFKGLKSNTIFTGGLPETGKDLIGRDAKYERLFVPLADFPKRTKELKTGGLMEIYKAASWERF